MAKARNAAVNGLPQMTMLMIKIKEKKGRGKPHGLRGNLEGLQ
jgi:hypothetical protein